MEERDLLSYENEEFCHLDEELIKRIEEARLNEIQKCVNDFAYFARKWIKITHSTRGLIPFQMYEYQERMIDNYNQHKFNIISKFRQGGATTTTVLWCMWHCLFKCDQRILVVSIGDREAKGAGKIVKNALDNLPRWLQPEMGKNNDHEKEFADTNSVIYFYSPKASRSMSLTYLVVDEAAFIQKMEELWAAMLPTLSGGGSCIVISTVNGIGNWYEETYHRAIEKKNRFNVIDIDYTEHPDYSKPNFAEEMRPTIGERRWLQEYERSFLGTGNTYIDTVKIAEIERNTLYNEPIRRIFPEYDANVEAFRPEDIPNSEYVGGALWIWKEPEEGREYMLSADAAEGVGEDGDYSAFHVLDKATCEQVAEFYSNMVPMHTFAQIISQIGLYYNTAQVIIENMGPGVAVISKLEHVFYYDNLYFSMNDKAGLKINAANRPIVLEALKHSITADSVKINSRRLAQELRTFIFHKSKKRAEASRNKHDDLVLSLAFALYIRDEEVKHVPIGMSDVPQPKTSIIFEADLHERIKRAILENTSKDYMSAEEIEKEDELATVIVGDRPRRKYESILNEFQW